MPRAFGGVQQVAGRHSEDLNYTRELIGFILTPEERISGQQFGEDTPEAPHVDRGAVPSADYDFRGTVEARLDVGVDSLVVVAA